MTDKKDKEIMSFLECKERIKEQLGLIIEHEYIYSVEELVDILKVSRMVVQKDICSKLDNFHLDRVFKVYIRACKGNQNAFFELARYVDVPTDDVFYFMSLNRDIVELINKSGLNEYRLSRRVLISNIQLRKFLMTFFVCELDSPGKEIPGSYRDLDEADVDCILTYKLEDHHHLMEHYGVKTLVQVSRRLEKKVDDYVLFKYVRRDTLTGYGKKRSLTRYLCDPYYLVDSDDCEEPIETIDNSSDDVFKVDWVIKKRTRLS